MFASQRIQYYLGDESTLGELELLWDFIYLRFVLQHVRKPIDLIERLFDCLQPGGILSILDMDENLISYYPEIPLLDNLLAQAKLRQQLIGGDRQMGRKLGYLLHQSGFEDIQVQRIDLSSTQISIDLLLNILLGFNGELVGSLEKVKELKQQLVSEARKREFFLNIGAYFVSGKKLHQINPIKGTP